MISRRSFLALTAGAIILPATSWGGLSVPPVLDHVLLGSSDLKAGIAFVKEHTGVTAAFGGVHPGRGTRNALLSLGDRHYLEIIAPDPAQTDAPDHYDLKKLTTPRLVGWAAHPGDLNAFAARLRNATLAFDGPTPGSRRRPDGRLLEWKTLNLRDNRAGLLPFFIEWSNHTVHPSVDAPAGCKILRFEVSAPDGAGLQRISTLLNLDVPVTHGEKPHLLARIGGLDGRTVSLTS
jgi:glyoxalase-like protein